MSTTNSGEFTADTVDAEIGRRVTELRGKVSQAELARRIEMMGGKLAQTYLSELEKGKRRWNSELLFYVSQALGARLADLMPDAPPKTGGMAIEVSAEEMATLMLLRTRGPKAAIVHLAGQLPD